MKKIHKRSIKYISLLAVLSSAVCVTTSTAQSNIPKVICSKNSTGALALRSRCKRGETTIRNRSALIGSAGATGAAGANGSAGANGAAGADGAIRVYGDGSAGALNVSSSVSWFNNPPANNNTQFSTCTVASGVTLTVPSGTIIRCNSTANIEGAIAVLPVVNGAVARRTGNSFFLVEPSYQAATTAPGFAAAGPGEISLISAGSSAKGGFGGTGLKTQSSTTAGYIYRALLLNKPFFSGGGGAASAGEGGFDCFGGSGGGAFALIAKGAVAISSSIVASGGTPSESGSGGGSGGMIVIASAESVSLESGAALIAAGSDGAGSDASRGAGGGGGGGIIQIIAPTTQSQGTVESFASVAGGNPGSNAANQSSSSIRQGGSGGGGLGGDGGVGANVSTTAGSQPANAAVGGLSGIVSVTNADPAALLIY